MGPISWTRRAAWGATGALLPLLLPGVGAGGDALQDVRAGESGAQQTDPSRGGSEEGVAGRCRECHPLEAQAWEGSPMGHALGPLSAGELAGLAPVAARAPGGQDAQGAQGAQSAQSATAGGYAYCLEQAGSGGFFRESWTGGGETIERTAPLAFGVGAGVRDRSYVALLDERLWFAPLERITTAKGGHRAALAPFEAIHPGTRLTVAITPECLACHTDEPPPRAWPLNVAPDASVWSPHGITCAGCHAHAAEHVAWRSAEKGGEHPDGDDPVTNPSKLSRVRRLSLCARCHLQGDARIELVPDAPGRLRFPAPGEDLLATRAVFVAAHATDDVGFVSQTERLVLSRCFLGSKTLVCETCHAPHRALSAPGEREHARAGCLQCHPQTSEAKGAPKPAAACSLEDAEGKRGKDCVDCHMPARGPFDVAGIEIHDHWIRRRPPAGARPGPLRFLEAPDGDWVRFLWPGEPPPAHANDPGLRMMALANAGQVESAAKLVDAPPADVVAKLPMYHHVRASLLEGLDRRDDAVLAYRRALALDPALAEASTNLGLLLGRLGRANEGMAVLDALIDAHPLADGALANRALLWRSLGEEEAFLRDLERSFQLRPRPELAAALARFFHQSGHDAEARRWAAEAHHLDPAGAEH